MGFEINREASDLVCHAVLITGTARSGTTILGKIVHSFDQVEYAFEPPLLFSLIPIINDLPQEYWKLLFETYLYEDVLINAVSGRSINCNLADDSSIYNVKVFDEIQLRLRSSVSKCDAVCLASGKTIAFKMPDIAPFLPTILRFYPALRLVIIRRNACDTLNSLMRKKWFATNEANQEHVWPFIKCMGIAVPFWVKREDHHAWVEMSELDRCAYYYIRITKCLNNAPAFISIDYDTLIRKPMETVQQLADQLGLHFGAKTINIVDSIHPMNSNKDESILDKVSPSLLDSLTQYSRVS